MKTKKYDNDHNEISIGDRIIVVLGNGFQGVGNVILQDGAIRIDWVEPPVGVGENLLCLYNDIEIVGGDIESVPFHNTLDT